MGKKSKCQKRIELEIENQKEHIARLQLKSMEIEEDAQVIRREIKQQEAVLNKLEGIINPPGKVNQKLNEVRENWTGQEVMESVPHFSKLYEVTEPKWNIAGQDFSDPIAELDALKIRTNNPTYLGAIIQSLEEE